MSMTKTEAIQAMNKGFKVRHKWFSKDEWMICEGLLYRFEDGCLCTPSEFWYARNGEYWQTGWEVVG